MSPVNFDDLLDIRKGDETLTMGYCPSRIETIATPADWEIKAAALRNIFRHTLGRPPDAACPLDPRTIDETDCGDYVMRKVEYSLEPDERISAYLLVPKELKGRAPGLLCIHPTTQLGKEQTVGSEQTALGQDRAYGLHLVKRGYVTLAYDLLSAGERCYKGFKSFDTAPFYEKYPQWSVRGKDLWDVARAVDLLQTVPEADPARIGSIGHSQGGGITIHAMALDPRIKAGVSSCGAWPERLSKNPFNHARTGWWVGRPLLRPYCFAAKPFPIDLHECIALSAPRALMFIAALNDCKYDLSEERVTRPAFENLAENVSKVFALLGAPDNFKMVLHIGGHGFAAEQREQAYRFLDEKLNP